MAITVAAFPVHGYHPGVEDAEIYLPGILKLVRPTLFPRNAEFFQSHAGMTLFPNVIAVSIRLTHTPVAFAMMGWQCLSILWLLYACFRIARLCFGSRGAWCGVALVAGLLTLPVAGTALYIVDQYVTSRSLSTPAAMLAIAFALEERYWHTGLLLVCTALVHPLMSLFAGTFVVLYVTGQRFNLVPALAHFSFFPPISGAYRRSLDEHPYFLLSNWAWYEWLGVVAPFAVLAAFVRVARRGEHGPLAAICRTLIVFQTVFLGMAVFISVPGRFEYLSEIQPLRSLHLLYCLMFLLGGGLLGEYVLRNHIWRWALLFIPLGTGMSYAQLQLFPSSPHLELPWRSCSNQWVQTFEWIRRNTPEDAYFALDPEHATQPGEDQHGFRAIARRSMLADDGKDSGAVSMFPSLAAEWAQQVDARRNWKNFRRSDFARLRQQYGVDWVILQDRQAAGMVCPYRNHDLRVCRVN
ncbi:MAG: DUF6798 domain-containing protein [Bryobacteraceae bacterium]